MALSKPTRTPAALPETSPGTSRRRRVTATAGRPSRLTRTVLETGARSPSVSCITNTLVAADATDRSSAARGRAPSRSVRRNPCEIAKSGPSTERARWPPLSPARSNARRSVDHSAGIEGSSRRNRTVDHPSYRHPRCRAGRRPPTPLRSAAGSAQSAAWTAGWVVRSQAHRLDSIPLAHPWSVWSIKLAGGTAGLTTRLIAAPISRPGRPQARRYLNRSVAFRCPARCAERRIGSEHTLIPEQRARAAGVPVGTQRVVDSRPWTALTVRLSCRERGDGGGRVLFERPAGEVWCLGVGQRSDGVLDGGDHR